jgi:hypothetical protein
VSEKGEKPWSFAHTQSYSTSPELMWDGDGVLPLSLKSRRTALSENVETLTVPQVLLFMRAGPLYTLSRDQRRETLHGRVPEENVERLLNESYLPIEDWAKFSDADIQELQKALFKVGRNLGLESVWKNHDSLYDDLGTDHDLPRETRSEQMSRWIAFAMDPFYDTLAIDSFISDRMKRYEKKSFSLWHLANILFFFFALYLGDAVFEDGSILFFCIWTISGIYAVSASARETTRVSDLNDDVRNRLCFVLEEPLTRGMEKVFGTERLRRSHTKPPSLYYKAPEEE